MKRQGEKRTIIKENNASYECFIPTKLADLHDLNINEEINKSIVKANIELAKLEEASLNIPDINTFLAGYVYKEALLTSKIEGTQCTMEDIFDENNPANINLEVEDVIRYHKALNVAIHDSNRLPLCNRMLCRIHEELLNGIDSKYPGSFRRTQNWIGGKDIKSAKFVPPNPEEINNLMLDLEKFINHNEKYDLLVVISLVHYQFETIHPFLDGNGRIGRMIALLMMLEKKALTYPILYLSYFLKKNKLDYSEYLTKVRRTGDYESWLLFFINAIAESSKESYLSIKQIDNLVKKHKHILEVKKCKKITFKVFDILLEKPIINIKTIKDRLGVTFKTASLQVKKMLEYKILSKTSQVQKNQTFVYKEYLDILSKNTEI